MAITVSAVAEALNEVSRTYSETPFEPLRRGLEFEGAPSTPIDGDTPGSSGVSQARPVKDTYDRNSIIIGSVLQPFQHDFTPSVTVAEDAISTRLQKAKVDLLFTSEEIEKMRHRWHHEWGLWYNMDPIKWSFVAWIYKNRVEPQIKDDLNLAAWAGVAAAPVQGTAGTAVQAFTGYRQRIADYITAAAVTPIATGPITAADAYTKVEGYCSELPEVYSAKGGVILCSPTLRRQARYNYRDLHGTGNGVSGNDNDVMSVDGFNIQLKPILQMAGSSRLIFQPNGVDTLIHGTLLGQASPVPAIRWESFERTVKGMLEIERFFDFERPEEVFVNDQA